jgi:hypothetical protein
MIKIEKIKPKNKNELIELIKKECEEKGWNCNLNFIDTSLITDMSELFSKKSLIINGYGLENFNGDISGWDISKVENMESMFSRSEFDGDISKWDVGSVRDMYEMFRESKFNQDISEWNVSNVENMSRMFQHSNFNQNLDKWKIYNVRRLENIFRKCLNEKPYWYKCYKKDEKERKEQIDIYHLSKKIENNLNVKKDKINKI